MTFPKALPFLAILGLAACDVPPGGLQTRLPENVLAIVGPNQDLSTARLIEADNCYWYDHKGIVETTPLPLRTAGGQHICIAKEAPDAEPAPAS